VMTKHDHRDAGMQPREPTDFFDAEYQF